MGILNIDLNNINFDDSNYDEEDPDTIVLIRLLAWHIKFEKRKELIKKISVELMPVAWHPNRWWDFWWEKRNRSNVYWRFVKMCVGSIRYGGIETFCWGVRRQYTVGGYLDILKYLDIFG